MARMSDILRADELKAAKDAYELWLRKSRAEKQAAYIAAVGDHKRVNRSSRRVFIQPFGAPEKFWYETKALAPAALNPPAGTKEENDAALITALLAATAGDAGYVLLAVPAGANNVSNRAKKIQFAKVKCTERTGEGAAKNSRITGLPYMKYQTNSVSTPFGYKTGTADKSEQAAARAIRSVLLPDASPPPNRFVGFTSQGDVGNIVIAAS